MPARSSRGRSSRTGPFKTAVTGRYVTKKAGKRGNIRGSGQAPRDSATLTRIIGPKHS